MLDYVSDFDIFCWRSKNMLYFLENRAWNGVFEKPLLMLRRFFENPPVLPWTLRDLRKPTSPPLNLKGSSKTHQSSLTLKFFLKSTRPSLPLKKAPPLSPSPFPLRVQGMYQPPYSVLKPLRYKVGGPSEVYASSGAAVCGMRPPCWVYCLLEAERLLVRSWKAACS